MQIKDLLTFFLPFCLHNADYIRNFAVQLITNVSLKNLRIMKTLNERLTDVFNILIENGVFLLKFNQNALCKCPDERLHFVVNFLSTDDFKIILSVCELYSLEFGINSIPSVSGNNLCVIFKDKNNG